MRFYILQLFLFSALSISSQVKLNHYLYNSIRPSDNDTIEQSLHVKHLGNEPGYKRNETVNNFKLYGLKNDSLDLGIELAKGKSVFLINGSLSCPLFRKSLRFFDSIANNNKNISCFIIYTIEAHPDAPFVCPYTDEVTPLKANEINNIHLKQHATYADRKKAAVSLINLTKTKIPLFLDTPTNAWIHAFGEMPYLACLVSTEGKLKYKYLDYKTQRREIIRDLKLEQ